jgi:hypothetical protein
VLPLGSPSFSILLLKEKDLAEPFDSGTMYENVAPHAWSPPNFPHTEKEAKVMYAPWQGSLNGHAFFLPKVRNPELRPLFIMGYASFAPGTHAVSFACTKQFGRFSRKSATCSHVCARWMAPVSAHSFRLREDSRTVNRLQGG